MLQFFFTTQFYVTKNKIISKELQHFLIHIYDLCQIPPSPPPLLSHIFLVYFSFSSYLYNLPNGWLHPNRIHQMDGYILN